jgi:hypothetical protein
MHALKQCGVAVQLAFRKILSEKNVGQSPLSIHELLEGRCQKLFFGSVSQSTIMYNFSFLFIFMFLFRFWYSERFFC